jgi:hypothetical protein
MASIWFSKNVVIRKPALLLLRLLILEVVLQGCAGSDSMVNGNVETHMQAANSESQPGVKMLSADPDGCTWVESKASVAFGDQDTKHQALAQAVTEARIKAIQGLLGVRLEHRFIDFQQENNLKGETSLTEHLLRASQLGRAVREEIISAGPVDESSCIACRYVAHIRTCIVPERERADKEFSVSLKLNRLSYVDGDDAVIAVTPSRDAYVYVYDVDMDLNATLVFPNDYAQSTLVKAGTTWMYPSQELQDKGIHVTARLMPNMSVSAEMIRVIASKVPLSLSLLSPRDRSYKARNVQNAADVPGKGSFLHVMKKLMATDTEWVEDAQAFTIRRQ